MRSYEEYRAILVLWEEGENKKAISRILDIPRRTVVDCIKRYDSVQGLEDSIERASRSTPDEALARIGNAENTETQKAYAYLLGLYLGDGSISLSKGHRVYKLRVTLDKRYPNIINACGQTIQVILPNNHPGSAQKPGCIDVVSYYKFWPDIFPQHGKGRKHEREIALEAWQLKIVDTYPLELFRGLYHSDGSRDSNIVNGKSYPRYAFRNMSQNILRLFCYACNLLELHWTIASNGTSVNISKRPDVAFLDTHIGPKS
ncbi:MAG: hypothetical protein H6672_02715 [Anaerolineaceae bacterium]|nr:hypothetical protein [Anaerolineaceae bacterium]